MDRDTNNTKQSVDFSFDTISEFDNHINNSIQGYDLLHSLVLQIVKYFAKPNTTVLDIGCTSGKLINEIAKDSSLNGVGYDITDHNFIDGPATLIKTYLTKMESYVNASVITSIFTLQFIELDKRQSVLNKIHNALNKTGIFIFCEKEYTKSPQIQEAFIFTNYDNKRKYFTPEEILNKEKTLRKIMHPLTEAENKAMLKKAGFKVIDTFYQSMNFKGYICIK